VEHWKDLEGMLKDKLECRGEGVKLSACDNRHTTAALRTTGTGVHHLAARRLCTACTACTGYIKLTIWRWWPRLVGHAWVGTWWGWATVWGWRTRGVACSRSSSDSSSNSSTKLEYTDTIAQERAHALSTVQRRAHASRTVLRTFDH
jgi:hypothetical protein